MSPRVKWFGMLAAARTPQHLWVAPAAERAGPTACFPDGAVGLDALAGCEIAISEATPRQGYLRCR